MKSERLTSKEEKILGFIRQYIRTKGIPPTLREIMLYFRYKAIGTVQDHMASLQKKGVIMREKGKARSIRISESGEKGETFTSVPVLGQIAAGYPVLSEENIMGYVPVMSGKPDSSSLFALRVSGDSMVEAGIYDGDIAIIESKSTACNKDIVVAWIDGETTLKEFRKQKDGEILLVPHNSQMSVITLTESQGSDVRILGKMVGLHRKY